MYQEWGGMVVEEIMKIKPDITVSDFFSRAGVPAADKLGIPCVINIPGTLDGYSNYGFSGIFDSKRSQSCCGCLCYSKSTMQNIYYASSKYMMYSPEVFEYYMSFNKRVCLWNTYWGLEEAVPVPPNYIVTGPLNDPPTNLIEKFKTKDPELFDWMEKAQEEGQDVVYVSIGSICKWQ
jgi:hypothetical protein